MGAGLGAAGLLSGAFMMVVLGLAAGNYATSFIYRIPRSLKIANDPPYCDHCRSYLELRDMFPFFSWIMNRGRCRFCDAYVPSVYTVFEFCCAVWFVLAWLRFGIGESLVLTLAIGTSLMTVAATYYLERKLFSLMLLTVAGCSAIYRTLLDGSIYGFIGAGYLVLMATLLLWGGSMLLLRTKLPIPDYLVFLPIAGLVAGNDGVGVFLVLTVVFAALVHFAGKLDARLEQSAWIMGGVGAALTLTILP